MSFLKFLNFHLLVTELDHFRLQSTIKEFLLSGLLETEYSCKGTDIEVFQFQLLKDTE